jgi:serine phosphatase RsbU (regulator of sigma subunit)
LAALPGMSAVMPTPPRLDSATLPFDYTAATAARQRVVDAMPGYLKVETLALAELLVGDVVASLGRRDDLRRFTVDVAVDADREVTVTVNASSALAPTDVVGLSALSPDGGGRRSVALLDSLAAAWGVRRAGGETSVWFTIAADPVPNSPALDTRSTAGGPPDQLATIGPGPAGARDAAELAAAGTAIAASDARRARASAAALAAEIVAAEATRTATAVRRRADDVAATIAAAASAAAITVSSSIATGGEATARRASLVIEAAVLAAAAANAAEADRAAALVARAVATAAAAVEATTAAAAASMQDAVVDAAIGMRAVTAANALHAAAAELEREAAQVLSAQGAVAASTRMRAATRQLVQSGLHDRAVAIALQEAMLTSLPSFDDLVLAARYLTAAENDQVGGDWYDAIALPNGSTALVIGDVIGHDIAAAAIMGQLRNLLRALVCDRHEPPSAIVGRLDRAMRDLHVETMATLVLIIIEPDAADPSARTRTITWTNAGHPAPAVIGPDGNAQLLDETTDILLGVRPETIRRDHHAQVPPGATLLLYTDGLVETREDSIADGQGRLLNALSTHADERDGSLLDTVLSDLIDPRPSDDTALLAVRFAKPT